MIEIRNIQGSVLLTWENIPKGCVRKFELMKHDCIVLKFSLDRVIHFGPGCYVWTDDGRFETVGAQYPAYNAKTGGYDYELTLDAGYWKWKNKLFKYMPETGGQEAAWNLTAALDVQLGIVLRNLKALGYTYNGQAYTFAIDESVENKPRLMSYSNLSILDALFAMAQQWECECWVSDNIIHFGKLENSTPVRFEIGRNVAEMLRSDSQDGFATRLYVFGSERNLPKDYRKAGNAPVVNGVVQRRLMLPEGTPYIDAFPGMSEAEAVEQVVVFDDIYPHTECVVGKVGAYTSTVKDESTDHPDDTITETFYYVTDTSGFVFDKEYILPGEELRILFQSGRLNGLEFGCIFRAKGETLDGKELPTDVYELVANEDYGRKLPDAVLCPDTGDKFILVGWDSTKIGNTSLVVAAENELKKAGEKRMEKMKTDPSTYRCRMMSDAAYQEDGLHQIYEAGQRVELVNKAYFEKGRVSRIIGFEYKLDKPYDTPTYVVGETASYSRLNDLEEKVDELVLNGQTFVGGNGGGVYLITSYDHTPPTEKNTFSAKRLVREFAKLLRKDQPDSTAYLLKLLGGAEVGEAIDSFIAGKGTILDKNGHIQTDRLEVRNSLKVLELIINRIQGMENDFVFAPTRKVVKVEKVDDTTYKLFLDPKMDGDLIPFREGNILYSIVNDWLTGGSSYYTSYMRVLTTNQNEYSITVSLYPDAEVPGGKNYLPAEGYNVSRRGDVHLPQDGQSSPDAQSWYLSSSEGRLLFLQNVVKPVLEDYNYALSIGKFPRVQAVEDIGLPEDAVGVMAETIVAQHIYQYDYNGDIIANKVHRGAWAREVAESDKPYRRVTMESIRPTGTKYTLLEQHTVYHLGCLWGCLVDKTTEEPKWNAQGWQLLEGNSELTLNLQLDGTEAFHIGEVDVNILAQVLFGHNDITEDVKAQKGFVAEWFRDTENAPADNLWKPAYVGDDKLRIHIDNGNEHGVGSDFGFGCKKVVFTCRVYVPVDGGMRQLEQSLGFNLV